ncbi:MAG: CoB--CoM heterodisulfide reductase subunit B [Candidatus Lokiarchaeota archaeon]|nr:CoB--CoM heterodisulfide reductase subunit B [Candidatus Lokiarchaeota archaeon]
MVEAKSKNTYSYFLGCLTPNRYPGIEATTIKVLNLLGIKTIEMDGASCCPAPGVFGSFDLVNWATIAARNITIAEETNTDITMTCNGCYGSLQEANHLLKENKELRKKVNDNLDKVGRKWKGNIDVRHVIELLVEDIGVEKIRDNVVQPLTGIKVAVHYGCHFMKPSSTRGHGLAERPGIIEEIVEAVGATNVDYKDKMMCCGAGGGVRAFQKDVALDFTKDKILNMKEVGADCVVNPCAFCHFQFDTGQKELREKYETDEFNMPVLFLTQLIGFAYGLSPHEMGLDSQNTSIQPLIDKITKIK